MYLVLLRLEKGKDGFNECVSSICGWPTCLRRRVDNMLVQSDFGNGNHWKRIDRKANGLCVCVCIHRISPDSLHDLPQANLHNFLFSPLFISISCLFVYLSVRLCLCLCVRVFGPAALS
ncbi:hypothetical protein, unlikely [Trypanosoma brucei gambiense DAL972]|uniref:Uncharacterized protein n=1 Tax=Trypanosoma brucei gambiense (strain MHOM/CI/86/DAL972) TaxID=679716 RepID=D0A632_TRYB9|nr:hypothetical protein, unlikely [Trypanosoma brucei gambiense DAL972]CBH17133.1 hypothetical protein, unlikely [Trypanosoma brucei gambiense DAL972]|eukprot:XP_011779397.1 hypothetical protein, unlikely [Trypanosoma brucei gambiense DAL972]